MILYLINRHLSLEISWNMFLVDFLLWYVFLHFFITWLIGYNNLIEIFIIARVSKSECWIIAVFKYLWDSHLRQHSGDNLINNMFTGFCKSSSSHKRNSLIIRWKRIWWSFATFSLSFCWTSSCLLPWHLWVHRKWLRVFKKKH